MNFRGPLCVLFVALAATAWAAAPDKEQAAFASMSGKELVRELRGEKNRSRAFYELWRRAKADKDEGYAAFLDTHYDADVVTCPQGEGKEPIYIVLYGFYSRTDFSPPPDYVVKDPDGIFPPLPLPERVNEEEPAIEAFTADGERITPFGGNNVLNGSLADLNGDGILERAEITHYGSVAGVKNADVLEVSAVRNKAQPLLTLLLNWGAEDWTFRLQKGKDGISDIEIGPLTKDGMKPKAVFRWDAKALAYTGPEGKPGDHFRRLTSERIWDQIKAFQSAGLTFPNDPDFAEPEEQDSPEPVLAIAKPTPPPSKPYRRQSLDGLSDTELLSLMGPGRNAFDFERESIISDHLPTDFWKMDPRKAALALAEANRSEKHRAKLQLAVDGRDPERPPESGTLALSVSSSRCYNAIDAFYFLRVDPKESYLAYARSWAGGVVFYSVVFDQPAFDLRLCPLSYDDARHLAATIWWLNRLRSRPIADDPGFSGMSSTADGDGTLTLRDGKGKTLIDQKEILWAGQLSERWDGGYDHEAFVNFTTYLVTQALTERLGRAWTNAEPRHDQNNFLRQNHGPLYTEEEIRHFNELTNRFLSWFSPTQDRLSYAISACAVEAAGTLVMPETKPLLEKIRSALPDKTKRMRNSDEISDEILKVLSSNSSDPKEREARDKKLKELEAEEDAIAFEASANSPAYLRQAATVALRKIKTANDPAALYTWAIAKEPGSQWALQRLSRLDQPRYAQALERWMNKAEAQWARQIFEELRRVDPARATAIAATLPPEKQEALAVASFALLQSAGQLTDEKERLAALMAVLQNPKSGWEERGKAIDLLVPPENPLRYSQQEVDDALLRVLDPDQADEVVNFTLPAACRALALRQRRETFDRMEKLLTSTQDSMLYSRILGAMVLLAQSDPARFNPRLKAILAPQLKETNKQMTEILWAIWTADLRDFLPELEQLATSDPDDYEDRKAASSGGKVSPVTGRFHLARKIADVWNATDAVTQIRLLTALALAGSYQFVGEPLPERVARLKAALQKSAKNLTAKQRQRLDEFFQAVGENRSDLPDAEGRQKIMTLVKGAIAIP